MKKAKPISYLFALLILTSCQNQKKEAPDATYKAGVITILDSLLNNPEIEAVSVGIIDGDEHYYFNEGTLLNGKAPTKETLYEIASITKTFTGTLLAQAIHEGKVHIDDDIRTFLPDSFPNLEYKNQPITFRNLVTHQSGLPNMFPDKKGLFDNPDWDQLPFQINELQKDFSRKDFFAALANVQLDTFPCTSFGYSNAGANLLGYLLEEIYQKPYEDLLKEYIFIPLKMTHTIISRTDLDTTKLAYGQNHNKIKMPLSADKDMNAEGGIISSVDDMLKYIRFHLDESNEVASLSHSPMWDGKFGDFEAGLFWQINKNGEQADRIFQNGGAYGTSSWATFIPEQNLGIFMVTNVSGPNVHQKLMETTDKMIEEVVKSRKKEK